jgi:serine protease Do
MISIVSLRRGIGMAVAFMALLSWSGAAQAQPTNSDLFRNNPKIVKLFRSVVATPSESTVRVQCDGKDVALGTVVGTDGWIITKASELHGPIVCKFKDGREYTAKITGVEAEFDLAMLKVDTGDLKAVEWEDSKAAKVGRWVASVAPAEDPIAIGVISVATRDFKAGDQPPKNLATNGGYLGVGLEDAPGGAKINLVSPKSAAEKAGLKVNDVVTQINAKKVLGMESMINIVQKYKPGDEITIKLLRAEEEMEIKATLGKRPANMLGNPQERMGSALSNRRGGFPKILQHDTIIKPGDCGGPLVDLDGKVVGINIARAGRTESYAIPSEAVRALLTPLMSGKLAPPPEEPDEPPSIKRPRK